MAESRIAAFERRMDELVKATVTDQAWGKMLWRQFKQHEVDDDRRHKENIAKFGEIEKSFRDQADASRQSLDAHAAALRDFTEAIRPMLPTIRRLRARESTRRAIIHCLSRWRHIVVGAGISAGALFVWFDGQWPKIVAMIRKLLGPG